MDNLLLTMYATGPVVYYLEKHTLENETVKKEVVGMFCIFDFSLQIVPIPDQSEELKASLRVGAHILVKLIQ